MATIEVRTQAELDAALAKAKPTDIIAIRGTGWFEVYGSSTVTAYDSSTVTAYDSSTVTAYGSSTVTAYGSSTVRAYGSSTVRAYGSSTVRASKYVAVHHFARDTDVRITGGVLIEVPALYTADAWSEYHGIVTGGTVTLYKAVDDDYATPHARRMSLAYLPGTTVEAPDWKPTPSCGNGLHACASPTEARSYNPSATRYVAVTAPVADIVVIDESKVKAPRLTVVAEVDIDGNPIAPPKPKRTRKAVK